MHLGAIVQQLSLSAPTTAAVFLSMMERLPFSGAARPKDWIEFIKRAQACCGGAHALQQRHALARILAIVQLGAVSPHFPRLGIPMIAWQLVARVLDPRLFERAGHGLCGPAAFAVHLARTHPLKYVEFAFHLLKSGAVQIGAMKIEPGALVRGHLSHHIAEADWLMLASLRDSDARLDAHRVHYGGATFLQLLAWMKRAGYGTVVGVGTMGLRTIDDHAGASLLGTVGYGIVQAHPSMPDCLAPVRHIAEPAMNIGIAASLLGNGWKVFLMVGAKFAAAPKACGAATAQTADAGHHWLLAKDIILSHDGKISIVRYAAGRKARTAPIALEVFLNLYGGFVAINELGPAEASAAWQG